MLPKDWFLQFDQKTQTLRGMPMSGDEGMYSLNIVAFLMAGTPNPATTSFRIQIKRPKGRKSRVNHELSMTIDTDYDDFVASVDNKVDLANKVKWGAGKRVWVGGRGWGVGVGWASMSARDCAADGTGVS